MLDNRVQIVIFDMEREKGTPEVREKYSIAAAAAASLHKGFVSFHNKDDFSQRQEDLKKVGFITFEHTLLIPQQGYGPNVEFLYFRRVYIEFYDIFQQKIEESTDQAKLISSGTPGIGKSIFGFYISLRKAVELGGRKEKHNFDIRFK